jgi:RNase P subunit RPR2
MSDESPTFQSEDWPHGLRCASCERLFTDGMPYSERLEGFQDDIPMCVITCVECALTNAPIPA